MNWPIIIAGLWYIVDGIGSIIIYQKQSNLEHLLRIIRALGGVVLCVYSYYQL
jgi:hypothetical protein